ncbi:zinc finger CCHC domain-containing protein 8 [Gouania willdenowi]|uniref:zinc finger CCHC domain-containing protein 8 n=1 Tax=Gouania willdenowi TaxID=441366 RepID=UPI00105630C9|nr:zinc finger CCHC domain-containing protein 8 [Gouania willdenowi]
MAEVDFGDSELFEQLDDFTAPANTHIRFTEDEPGQKDPNESRDRLEECEDHIQRLTEQNNLLRKKLKTLIRPSGITIDDVNTDGPLLQILFTNNTISKQCRQEIEDCICSVILQHQKPGSMKTSSFHIKPQPSAFALEEDPPQQAASSVQTTTEAFKVVGSVLYFTAFSVDKLGQPLVNENPQLTDGWDVPTYLQVFNQVIGTDGQDMEVKEKRPKSMCFNCGSVSHQLRDCPKPKDMAAINERRKEFNQSSNLTSNQRYHADFVEERFAKFKPGVISEELLRALGIDNHTLPPLIYRMRQLGYPPGWLKEAEMENSGLSLYDGKSPTNGSSTNESQNISYDISKLVDFPGFNVAAPHKMKDEFMHYGSVPMQISHMKQNYASYLSTFSSPPGASSNKRRQESDSCSEHKKKMKSGSEHSSDMDIESDPGTSYDQCSDFQFQPPQPPGSSCFSSPPPLPWGTPPSTPTPPPLPKGTPPVTPNDGSPALRSKYVVVDETSEETEDEMTLEELEEQQRQIWAALNNADTASSSDCETPVMGTPARSSSSVFTPARIDSEIDGEEMVDTATPTESSNDGGSGEDPEVLSQNSPSIKVEEDSPQSPKSVKPENYSNGIPAPIKSLNDTPQSPDPIKAPEDQPKSPDPMKLLDDTPQSPDPIKSSDDKPKSPDSDFSKVGGCVPHRSKFAAGIVPFEDTPEFTEVAEATGTYLRIRDLLKCSPRNLKKQ